MGTKEAPFPLSVAVIRPESVSFFPEGSKEAKVIPFPPKKETPPFKFYSQDPEFGDFKKLSEIPILTPEQEITLAQKIDEGDESARDELLIRNMRLCFALANKKFRRNKDVPLEDLISHAVLGLYRASQTFDWRLGNKFSTYATRGIKSFLHRAIENESTLIRIPAHVNEFKSNFTQNVKELTVELQREPTVEEVAEMSPVFIKKKKLNPEQIDELLSLIKRAKNVLSLDKPLGDSDSEPASSTLSHFSIFTQRPRTPEEEVVRKQTALDIKQDVQDVLGLLDSRSADMIRLYFGLDGNTPLVYRDIAKIYGLSGERVHQIVAKGLRTIKSHKKAKALLAIYLED